MAVAERVLAGQDELTSSRISYDWLGHGIYFWENNPERALQFAEEAQRRKSSSVRTPAVIGAVIDLGLCLDLLDSTNLSRLKGAYALVIEAVKRDGGPMPENQSPASYRGDRVLRFLDCAVIEALHKFQEKQGLPSSDSVRAVFVEGDELYPSSGFREKNHIQICVRNSTCIRGYFRVRNDRAQVRANMP